MALTTDSELPSHNRVLVFLIYLLYIHMLYVYCPFLIHPKNEIHDTNRIFLQFVPIDESLMLTLHAVYCEHVSYYDYMFALDL